MQKHIFSLLFFVATSVGFAQNFTASQKCNDTISSQTDCLVEVTVSRDSVKSFMKYSVSLPPYYSATEVDCKGGNFKLVYNEVKIIWITPPIDSTFTFSYKLKALPEAYSNAEIGGKLFYIQGNERKNFDIKSKIIYLKDGNKNKPVSVSVEPVSNVVSNVSENVAPVKTISTDNVSIANTSNSKTIEPKTVNASTPATVLSPPQNVTPNGRVYRVQIGAFKSKPNFKNFNDISTMALDNGLTKYFSGNFSTYEEAAKHKKEMLDKGFVGVFVVTFENGKIVK